MNDKEALKVLENLSIDYEGMDDDEIAEMDSAVYFAIAALEEKVASQLQDCKQVGDDLVSRQALCEYALNQKDKSVTPNDIMRFPPAKTEIIRCKDCVYYDPPHVENNGVRSEYSEMPEDAFDVLGVGLVSAEYGINIGGRCCRDYNVSYSEDKRVFIPETNYCGRAERRTDESD